MEKIQLLDKEKNPLKPIIFERNPKLNLFGLISRINASKSTLKIYELTQEKRLEEKKIIFKNNKLSFLKLLWDSNNQNILHFLSNPSYTNKNLVVLSTIDLEKESEVVEEYKFQKKTIDKLSMNCNPKETILACCSKEGEIIILDAKNKTIINTIKKDNLRIIKDCKFSPFNENYLLFSNENGNIYLYDLKNIKEPLKNFCPEEKEIESLSWHPNNPNLFCSGSSNNFIKIWDIDDEINSKTSFKTPKNISKVRFLKSNPKYIMCSYQFHNYHIDLWNLNFIDIPEYQFSGHSSDILGFDNDIEGKRLISCDKKGVIVINEMNKGKRTLDDITTSVIHFNNFNEIYYSCDKKLPKENFFEINEANDGMDSRGFTTFQSSALDENEKSNKERRITQKVYMLNFNHPEMQLKNKKIEKEDKEIYLKNDCYLNISSELRQYYIFNKDQIHSLFRSYIYYIEEKETLYKRKRFYSTSGLYKLEYSEEVISVEMNVDELDFSEKLIKGISSNLEYAKETLNNYNHISIWNTLLFLSNQETFKLLYDKYSGKKIEKKFKKKKRKNNKKPKNNHEDKILYDFDDYNLSLSPSGINLMTKLFIKELSRIIEYLIDTYGDIYLATIICYLFKPILFQDNFLKKRILRLIKQCINNLRKYQLYVDANHLIKYGPKENKKVEEKNEFKFILSCKKCGKSDFKNEKCNCKKELLCEECNSQALGLFIWCPGCGHREHINHINQTQRLYNCKACEHRCIF